MVLESTPVASHKVLRTCVVEDTTLLIHIKKLDKLNKFRWLLEFHPVI